jgi:hypothetical protein
MGSTSKACAMSVRVNGWPFRARMVLRISLGEKGEEGRFFFGDFRKFLINFLSRKLKYQVKFGAKTVSKKWWAVS